MAAFNIKIGSSLGQKNKFDLKGKSSSTTHFGHVWPTAVRALVPESSFNYKDGSVVRLAPLVAPVFGEAKLQQYGVKVLYRDLYPHFDNFLAKQSYSTARTQYVPSELPCISYNILTILLLRFGCYTIYKSQEGQDVDDVDGDYIIEKGNTLFGNVSWFDYLFSHSSSPLYIQRRDGIPSNPNLSSSLPYKRAYKPTDIGFSTPESCDICFHVGRKNGAPLDHLNDDFEQYLVCVKLSREGCNLRKVLLGLGYKLSLTDKSKVSLFELFAYYKAYFDVFENKREKAWTSTDAFILIDYFVQNGWSYFDGSNICSENCSGFLWKVLKYLSSTYYTNPADVFSSMNNSILPNVDFGLMNLPYGNGNNIVSYNNNTLPSMASGRLTYDAIQVIQKLTKYVTKSSVVGRRLDVLLKKLYGVDKSLFPDSPILGKSSIDVQISDVVNQSETESGFLGEYAGLGVGKSSGLNLRGESEHFGIFIVLSCVVPVGSWTNGINPNILRVNHGDFFNSAFDALGVEVAPKKYLYDQNERYLNNDNNSNQSLGFVPRYTFWKISPPDVINGDMSRNSTKSSYLPYLLDNVMTNDFSVQKDTNLGENTSFLISGLRRKLPLFEPNALRYVGKFRTLSNYDRIFRNSESVVNSNEDFYFSEGSDISSYLYLNQYLDDNILINNVFRFDLVAPMKQISESMDTDPEHYATEVNKS